MSTIKIVCIGNQKGGVGKTTTMVNLGYSLAVKGLKVLGIDADAQSNATSTLLKDIGQREHYSLVKALTLPPDEGRLTFMKCSTSHANFDIIPNTIKCLDWEKTAQGTTDAVLGLHRLIKKDKGLEKYDFCLIDTPPNIGIMMTNALMISDFCIVPIPVTDQYALDGFVTFLKLLQNAHEQNEKTRLLGVLITRYDSRATTCKKNLERILSFFESKNIPVFKTIIRNNIDISKAQSKRQTIFEFDKKKYGAIDYSSFANDFIEKFASMK